MKAGWETKKISEVCKLKSGTTISPSLEKNEGDVLYAKVGDMNLPDNLVEINISSRFVNSNEIKIKQIIPKGATIFPKRGGAIATNKKRKIIKPTIVDLNTMAIIPSTKIDNDYFFYWFKLFDLNDISNGANIPQINNYSFDEVYIPYPVSLKEQQRIVAILDKTFAAIAKAKDNAEQNLINAKELFESYLQNIFENKGNNWEEKTLNDVCEIISKLIDPKKNEYQNLIHIGAGNIESQKGTLIDLKTAKEEKLISGKFLFNENMVLYSKIRPYLMKVVKCDFKGLCSADIYPLAPINNVMNQDYLYYLLLSNRFTEYAIHGSQRAGMPKVNRKHLFAYEFCCPPVKEQQAIVKKLDVLSAETKRLEAIYQQKLEDLEELKKSILQKAFEGKL